MANRIINVDRSFDSTNSVPPTSRYANAKMIYYGSANKITLKTYKRTSVQRKINSEDKFMVITPGVAYRPDLVSNEVYGIPDFWWKIMERNYMKDILDFKAGVNIILPTDIFF